ATKPYRLRCSLLGHSMDVRAVAAAHFPDGAIVTGSRDRTTRIWIPNEGSPDYFESQCLTGPTNFVSSVCTVPPSDQYPSGLILVGSNDCCIYCFSPENPQPLYKLLGHSGVVCALAAGQFGTLLSGSWDKSARVWFGQKCMLTLEGHQGPVWAVQILPKQGLMLTGSADKTVRLWRAGKCERVFSGHEDCVRGLAVLSNLEFLSSSNDCTVRHWRATGDCLRIYNGHTNFVYSICVLPDGGGEEFVTCGEDRTLRVWASGGECLQTLRLPAQSIWSVACLANGDIIAGSSDGVARVFTRHSELQAPLEEQKAFEEEVSKSTLPAQELGDLKVNELPGKEVLLERGKRDGQTKLVRDGGVVSAFQWVAVDNEWQKIGDVVGAPNSDTPQGKVTFEGKEYDYVFDVDLDDGSKMKLPYNLAEDPWFAAQAFIHRNNLSQYYLDQVANFIVRNTKGMVMESGAATTGFADPFTGGSRYIPGTAPPPGSAPGNVLARTGSGQIPNDGAPIELDGAAGDMTPGAEHFFPHTTFLRFDVANTQGILAKLREFNTQVPPEDIVADEELVRLMALCSAACSPDEGQMAALEKIVHWPREFVFPALDLLRLALRNPAVNSRVCNSGGGPQLCSHLIALLGASGTSSNAAANQMLSLRALCNLFSQPGGEALALRERTRWHCGARGRRTTRTGKEAAVQLLTTVTAAAPELTDGEAQFRLLVAAGTVCFGEDGAAEESRDLARALDVPAVAEKWAAVDMPSKVGRCARELMAVLSAAIRRIPHVPSAKHATMSRIPKPGARAERRSNPQACFHLQKKESSLSMDLVKLARKSGQLNLTGRGMIEVPEIVWNINNLTEEERQGLSVSLDHCDGDRWWDQADLTKLYLSSNQLTVLSPDIERLQALNILEVNDNQLCGLPETIGKLGQLSKLNISRNKIESLPDSFFELKELRQLIGHHNSISELSDDISNLSLMEMMDLSNNRLSSLPATIGFLSRLTNLNLSHNNLTELPPEMGSMNALQVLDVSVNKLRSLPEPVGSLCHLEQLFVQQNELSALPPFSGCGKLKELHAGSNGIQELPIEVIETLLSLRTLDLKNNRLKTLSPDITMIQGLERLDLSNNDLSSLPYELGALVHLKGLGVEGNPLRTIRRDIVKRGTVHLLKWLQDHLEHSPEAAARKRLSGGSVTSDGSDLIDSIERFALKTTHALDLSKRSLQDVPEEIFKMASECDVNQIDLSKNSLTSLPKG
ncbi:hypothetical protein HPB47_022798, partial [Ixodes persulcatus]